MFCLPALLPPLVLGIFGTLLGLLASWFAMIFGFGVTALVLLVVLVVLELPGLAILPRAAKLTGLAILPRAAKLAGLAILPRLAELP